VFAKKQVQEATMKRSGTSDRYAEYQIQLRAAMRRQLPAQGLRLISADGRVRWTERLLVLAAVLMSWSPATLLQEALASAREALVAMYPTRRRPGAELSGFLKALQKRTADLLTVVTRGLRKRTQEQAGERWRWKEWVLLGVDGSRINVPRTAANEQAFGCAGRKKTGPQQLLLTLFHVDTGVPWGWRRDRGDGSERGLLRELLPELPEKTLLLADAGFTGYELLRDLGQAKHAFVVRAGRNVGLLRNLGYEVEEEGRGTVYLWPKEQQRKQPPLVLRLVELRQGRRRMALLTNVLDEAQLSDSEVAALYRKRWSIEVMYRSLKQTMGKRSLRAETPRLAECELDWAMVGLWLLGLMTQKETGTGRQWSPAAALRVVRLAQRNLRRRAGACRLRTLLARAVRDRYVRRKPKAARDWPHKKKEKPPGVPKIRTASPAEVAAAKELRSSAYAA
jgi:hypothetical protein